MSAVILYGPHWSAYTRTVRLTLLEKAVDYELREVDFSTGKMPSDQKLRHPFGKVPAIDHEGFALYETVAICRYINTQFSGPALEPAAPQDLARVAQIIAICDSYLSQAIRMGYTTEALINPLLGFPVDRERVRSACENIRVGLDALVQCCGYSDFLVGQTLSLADLHLAPLLDFLQMGSEGKELLAEQPRLRQWFEKMSARQSMQLTSIDLAVFKKAAL